MRLVGSMAGMAVRPAGLGRKQKVDTSEQPQPLFA